MKTLKNKLKTKIRGKFFSISKIFVIILLCVLHLHYFALNFHPTYHQKIVKQLQPMMGMAQLNLGGKDFSSESGVEPEFEKYIKELGLHNPGALGAGVVLPSNVSEEIAKKVQEGYDRHGYNAFVSNLISIDRDLPDTRAEECKAKVYDNLPKCSVIIPFLNEEWSLLLRTVHGVINRSPDELIEEILLIDDASDRGF